MKITTVELKHSNPSMGPHEVVITYTLTNAAPHEEAFDQLLQASSINKNYSLKDFLEAHAQKDEAKIREISAAYEPEELLACGATISSFSMTLEDGTTASVPDLRSTLLGGYYSSFIPYLVKYGTKLEYSGWGFSPIDHKPIKRSLPNIKISDPSDEEDGHAVSDY